MAHRPIFIVDDDRGHATLLERALQESGIRNAFVRFESGDAALAHMFADDDNPTLPVLIMLDLDMPGTSGQQVLEAVRKHPVAGKTPVVILTITDSREVIQRCYDLGCNFYLTKPVDPESFLKVANMMGIALSVVKLPHGGIRGPSNPTDL